MDQALAHLHECAVPDQIADGDAPPARVPADAPEFVRRVTARLLAGEGDRLPVSALPADGTFPTGTSRWEKRNLALEIPVWDQAMCIQCGKCVLVCPHAAIRAKVYEPADLASAPGAFKSAPAMWKDASGLSYSLQVAPEDCTGCTLCTSICPVTSKTDASHKAIDMEPVSPIRDRERASWDVLRAHSGGGRPRLLGRPGQARAARCSPCSSSRVRVPVAARRRTSSCSHSSSATVP